MLNFEPKTEGSKMKVAVIGLVLSSLSFGLDFARPEVSCSRGKYLLQVGRQADDTKLLGRLYIFKKINHPGYGKVSYPEPLTELVPVKRIVALYDIYRGKGFDLTVWDATQDMPTGDPEIDGKCKICGVFKGTMDTAKIELKGMECRIAE